MSIDVERMRAWTAAYKATLVAWPGQHLRAEMEANAAVAAFDKAFPRSAA
jgi:hypothetical protein